MKKFKRLTAGLLGAVMALSVCSFTAFAEDGKVAEIGNEKYESVSAALNDVTDGTKTTIKLIANTKEDIEIPEGKNIVLDLGDHTITNDVNHTIINKGT